MQAGVAVLWGLWLALSTNQAAPTAPAATTGRIAGRVTVEGANTPVAGARIMLLPTARPTRPMGPMGSMGMPPQALTDQDGRFVFNRLAPGSYRLDVQKTGFAPLVGPGRAQTTQVSEGQTTVLALQLQKGAVITGKLLDASGEPVTDVRVMAMHRINGGPPGAGDLRMIPAPGGGQPTNDVGEFRIASLAAGEPTSPPCPGRLTIRRSCGIANGERNREHHHVTTPAQSIGPPRRRSKSRPAKPSTTSSSACSPCRRFASRAMSWTRTARPWPARW